MEKYPCLFVAFPLYCRVFFDGLIEFENKKKTHEAGKYCSCQVGWGNASFTTQNALLLLLPGHLGLLASDIMDIFFAESKPDFIFLNSA